MFQHDKLLASGGVYVPVPDQWVEVLPHGAEAQPQGCGAKLVSQTLKDARFSPHLRVKVFEYPGGDVEMIAVKVLEPFGKGGKRKAQERTEMTPENLKRSQQRAKVGVRRSLLSISADRLLTLTTRENITDYEKSAAQLRKFFRLMRAKFPRFVYVAVPEQQKRGAWHWHIGLDTFYAVQIVRALWLKVVGSGSVHFTSPKKGGAWVQAKLASYLAKYITKAEGAAPVNSKRFWASRGVRIEPRIFTSAFSLYDRVRLSELFAQLAGVLPSRIWRPPDTDMYLLTTW